MKLFKNFKSHKKKFAIIQDSKKYSYDYLIKYSEKISKLIKKNSLIILISKNEIDSIAFYISCIKNGYYLIILDENSNKKFLLDTIKNFKPNYIFYPRKYINLKKKNKKFSFSNYCLEEIDKKEKKINVKNSIILTTSGTTSNPKFVRLSNKNLIKNTEQIIDYLNIKKNDITITTLPMAYSYGLSILNIHLEKGATIVINNDSVFSKNFWLKIKNFKVCSFGSVPAVYDYLKKIKFENFLTPPLKYLTVAGGKTSSKTLNYLYEVCRKNNIKFFVMYGQTEASPRMSYFDLTKHPKKAGSVGKPLLNSRFELYKDELIFYGENVSLGYAKNIKDLKKGDVNNGKIKTGDLGFKDKDNFYHIIGRKKKISKLFGLRINLSDIEKTLKKNSINVKAIIDDEKIKIHCIKKNIENKIKDLIFKEYKINRNYIEVKNEQDFRKNINFKNLK